MQENQAYNDEIDLKKLFFTLWRGKYFIIFLTMIFIIAGSLHLRKQSPKYEVSILLAPVQEEQARPNFGGLGGLASLAGISLPTSSASDFTKYKIMLKTKEISIMIFKEQNLIQEIFSAEWDDNKQIFREPKKIEQHY